MKFRIVKTLLKKELTDIFRDTKTIIIMIAIPLILYPLLFLASILITSNMLKESTEKTYNVSIVADDPAAETVTQLLDDALEKYEYHFEIVELDSDDDYEKLIRKNTLDAVIEAESDNGELGNITIYSMSSINKSDTCRSMIDKVMDEYKDELKENRLREALDDYDSIISEPFEINLKNYSSKEETTGMLVGSVMPFMMVISVLIGVSTIAIDISVGEKERGTLETLITIPVNNMEIVIAKFFATTVIAMFSLALNVFSFGLIGFYMFHSAKIASESMGDFSLISFIPSVLIMIPLMVLFTMFISALCLCIDFTAKSVKEANNYTTPLMLILVMGTGAAVLMNIKFNYIYALIPVLNISLLIKDLFMLKFDATMIALVFGATILHTMAAVFAMTKIFSSEDILFSEGLKSFKLFEKRSNMKEGQIPGIGDIIFMFVLMFLLSNFVGGYIAIEHGFLGVIISQLIVFLIPVLYSWYIKVDFKNLYTLNVPKVKDVIGVLFFVFGAYILNTLFGTYLIQWFPKLAETNDNLGSMIGMGGFVPSLIVIGMLPAIAEETAFRGFLYGTLKNKKIPIAVTMIITALVFAAYHMNLLQFIYVTLLGLLMSYIIYNSNSIFITAIFHLINNSLTVIIQFKSEWLEKIPLLQDETPGLSDTLILLGIGLALLVIGFLISDNKIGIFSHSKPSGKTLE